MRTQPGTTVIADRYAVAEELVRGPCGTTVRAKDRLLGRDVAVTLIHPALGDDAAFAASLSEETKRAAKVSGPGIARLLDTGKEDEILFLVREYVPGATARAVIARGPLAPERAVWVGSAVLDALAIAHEHGVLHVGIGLDDVMITDDGAVAVTGLGVASAIVAARPHDAARLIGEGLAPELSAKASGPKRGGAEPRMSQGREEDESRSDPRGLESDPAIDARTDVFAVGGLVFELLTGEPPGGRSSPRAIRPDVPRAVDRVVARALAPDPRDRFQDARVFSAALIAATRGRPVTPTEDVDHAGARLDWLRTWVAAPFAIGAVAVAVIGLGLWFGRLEVGGPLGIRPADGDPAGPDDAVTEVMRPVSAATYDPFGDGAENDSTAPYAIDGDPATAWRSENYFDGSLNKQGVGLVFDLGEPRDVTGFRLVAPNPGYVFHVAVGDDLDSLVGDVGSPNVAESDSRGPLDGSGRYVLVWITTVVPTDDGIRAEVAEFRVVVEAA